MNAEAETASERLLSILRPMRRVLVAYSGGIDSTLVLAAAVRAVGRENALGVIGVSPSLAARELEGAIRVAAGLGADVERLATAEMQRPDYLANGPDRCYHCKSELYSLLGEFAARRGYGHILDGTNADDRLELRPGRKAAQELGVRSPLLEAGLGKAQIRNLAREWSVPSWSKPASPCLSSRVPHGSPITLEKLGAVEQAEATLAGMGFRECRVRHHGEVARVEVPLDQAGILLQPAVRVALLARLKDLGFRYITLDLEGFRSGSTSAPAEPRKAFQKINLDMEAPTHGRSQA